VGQLWDIPREGGWQASLCGVVSILKSKDVIHGCLFLQDSWESFYIPTRSIEDFVRQCIPVTSQPLTGHGTNGYDLVSCRYPNI
jgi:hypothetical protein